ncbi:U32-like protein [Lissonota sp. PSUC_FEM 10030012]|nr:U32-like protein [Lissonota sp. PSUC_FEM 10030012]
MQVILPVFVLFFVKIVSAQKPDICHQLINRSCNNETDVYGVCWEFQYDLAKKTVNGNYEFMEKERNDSRKSYSDAMEELKTCGTNLTFLEKRLSIAETNFTECQRNIFNLPVLCQKLIPQNHNGAHLPSSRSTKCREKNASTAASWMIIVSSFFKYASVVIVGARVVASKMDPERINELSKLWHLAGLSVAIAVLDTYQLFEEDCSPANTR